MLVSTTRDYDACNAKVADGALSMIDFYQDICPRLQITFIFNGDTDPSVSYEGTRTAVKRIGFPELNGGRYRPWFYNQTAASVHVLTEKAPRFGPTLSAQGLGPRLGGEVVNYKHGLSFLTVHGSGHMVSIVWLYTSNSCLLDFILDFHHFLIVHALVSLKT
jgi:serine carboxypeptidase-like clade I